MPAGYSTLITIEAANSSGHSVSFNRIQLVGHLRAHDSQLRCLRVDASLDHLAFAAIGRPFALFSCGRRAKSRISIPLGMLVLFGVVKKNAICKSITYNQRAEGRQNFKRSWKERTGFARFS
jgi:hypothetical protein